MTVPATGLSKRLDEALRTIISISRAPAAVITGTETAIACHGDPTPDADTVFELGSITKTFTALLLAEMVTHGEVSYDDKITAYLPRTPTHADHPAASGHPYGRVPPPAVQVLPAGTTNLEDQPLRPLPPQ